MQDDLDRRIAAIVDDVVATINALMIRRDDIDQELARLRKIQRAFAPAETKQPTKATERQHRPLTRLTQAQQRIAAWISDQNDTFTAREVREATGLNDATIYTTLNGLRATEFIGKAGTTRKNRGQPQQLWQVMDRAVLDDLMGSGNGAAE